MFLRPALLRSGRASLLAVNSTTSTNTYQLIKFIHSTKSNKNSIFGDVFDANNSDTHSLPIVPDVGLSTGKGYTERELARYAELNAKTETAIEPAKKGEKEDDKKQLTGTNSSLLPKDDKALQEFYMDQLKSKAVFQVADLISPLKKALYNQVVDKHGFFVNDQTLHLNGEKYVLHLTKEEIEVMEPSIFLASNRLKSSIKKATIVNRVLSGLRIKEAINQCHFSKRKVGREIGEMLEQGLKQAEEARLDINSVYIAQIYAGSDGDWRSRYEAKGRGRMGVITHPYVHVKAILKTKMTTDRLKHEKKMKQEAKKPWLQLNNGAPVRQRVTGDYKW